MKARKRLEPLSMSVCILTDKYLRVRFKNWVMAKRFRRETTLLTDLGVTLEDTGEL